MFNNSGNKLKAVAKVYFVIQIVAIVIICFYILVNSTNIFIDDNVTISVLLAFITCIFTLAIGVLVSWIVALIIYSIGESAENTGKILNKLNSVKKDTFGLVNKENTKDIEQKSGETIKIPEVYKKVKCPKCDSELSYTSEFLKDKEKIKCPLCDVEIKINKK